MKEDKENRQRRKREERKTAREGVKKEGRTGTVIGRREGMVDFIDEEEIKKRKEGKASLTEPLTACGVYKES